MTSSVSECRSFKATQKCAYGDSCRYAHVYRPHPIAETSPPPKRCKFVKGECPLAHCALTHVERSNKLCDSWVDYGKCPHGDACWFTHEFPDLPEPDNIAERPLFDGNKIVVARVFWYDYNEWNTLAKDKRAAYVRDHTYEVYTFNGRILHVLDADKRLSFTHVRMCDLLPENNAFLRRYGDGFFVKYQRWLRARREALEALRIAAKSDTYTAEMFQRVNVEPFNIADIVMPL